MVNIFLGACATSIDTRPSIILDAEAYTSEGFHEFTENQWSRAQNSFSKALMLYQSVDNQQGVILMHINLAEVALALDDSAVCQNHLDEAINKVNHATLADLQSRIIFLYARNALKQNRSTEAESLLQRLLPEFDQQTPVDKPSDLQLAAIASRTRLAFVQEQDEWLWTQRYANALDKSASKNPAFQARLLRFQARWLQDHGQYRQADKKLQQALIDYKSIAFRPGIAITLAELGGLAIEENRREDAQDYYSRSIAVYVYLNNFRKVAELTENFAKAK